MARARTETVKHKPAVKLDERVPKEFLLETLVNALFPTSKPKGPALNENSFLHFCVVCEGEECTSTRRGTSLSWSKDHPLSPGTFVYGNFISVRKT